MMQPDPIKARYFLMLKGKYPDKTDDELVKLTENYFALMGSPAPADATKMKQVVSEDPTTQYAKQRGYLKGQSSSNEFAPQSIGAPSKAVEAEFNARQAAEKAKEKLGGIAGKAAEALFGFSGALNRELAVAAESETPVRTAAKRLLVEPAKQFATELPKTLVTNPAILAMDMILPESMKFPELDRERVVADWMNTAIPLIVAGPLANEVGSMAKYRNMLGRASVAGKSGSTTAMFNILKEDLLTFPQYVAGGVVEGAQIGTALGVAQALAESKGDAFDFGNKAFEYTLKYLPFGMAFDGVMSAAGYSKYVQSHVQSKILARSDLHQKLASDMGKYHELLATKQGSTISSDPGTPSALGWLVEEFDDGRVRLVKHDNSAEGFTFASREAAQSFLDEQSHVGPFSDIQITKIDDILSEAKIAAGKVGMGLDPSLVKKLGASMYKGSLGQILARELMQNALDSYTGLPDIQSRNPIEFTVGTLDGALVKAFPGIDPKGGPYTRVTVVDNGSGMSPEIASNAFMDLGGSGKSSTEAVGGYGLAKAGYLPSTVLFRLETVADVAGQGRVKTILEGNGERWINGDVDITTSVVPPTTATGSKLDLIFDKSANGTYTTLVDQMSTALREYDRHSSLPIATKIKILDVDGKTARFDSSNKTYYKPELKPLDKIKINSPHFKVTVLADPLMPIESTKHVTVVYRNRGAVQFTDSLYLEDGVPLPDKIVIDIESMVPVDDPNYPFTTGRDALKGAAATIINDAIRQMSSAAREMEFESLFKDLTTSRHLPNSYYKIIKSGFEVDDVELDLLASVPGLHELSASIDNMMQDMAAVFHGKESRVEFRKGTASPGQIADVAFEGITLTDKALAWNLQQRGVRDVIVQKGFNIDPSLIPDHNIIAYNPFNVLKEVLGTSFDFRDMRALANYVSFLGQITDHTVRELTSSTMGTILHELAHQLERGHDEAFAGVHTRMQGVFNTELVKQMMEGDLRFKQHMENVASAWATITKDTKLLGQVLELISDISERPKHATIELFTSHSDVAGLPIRSDEAGTNLRPSDEVLSNSSRSSTEGSGSNLRAEQASSQTPGSGSTKPPKPPKNTGSGNQVVPPKPPWEASWKPRTLTPFQKAIGDFVGATRLFHVRAGIASALDNNYGTQLYTKVWQDPQFARLKALNGIRAWAKRIEKEVLPLAHKITTERLELVSRWRESADTRDILSSFVKNRTMSPEDRITAAAMAKEHFGIDIDPSKIQVTPWEVKFARDLAATQGDIYAAWSLVEAYDKLRSGKWAKEKAALKQQAKAGVVPDLVVATQALEQMQFEQWKQLLDEGKYSQETIAASRIMQEVLDKYNINEASIYAVTLLADSELNKTLNRTEFAKQNKLTPQEIALGTVIDQYYEQLATEFGIADSRNLGFYMNHNRIFKPTRSVRQKGVKTGTQRFVNELTRAGKLQAYETHPINALVKYINNGYNSKHGLYKLIKRAQEALRYEVEKIPDPVIRINAEREFNLYLGELLGLPHAERLTTGAFLKEMGNRFNVKSLNEHTADRITDGVITLTTGALLGYRPGLVARDMFQTWANYFTVFGTQQDFWKSVADVVSSVDLKKPGVTKWTKLDELKREGIIPSMGPNPFMSGSEAELGQVMGAVSKVQKGLEKMSSAGLYLSGQEAVFEILHGAIYLDRVNHIKPIIEALQQNKLTKTEAYKKINLNIYPKSVQAQFDRLIRAGDFEKAIKGLAQTTSAQFGVIYGSANLPHAWKTIFGRLLGQFNTWTTWQRSTIAQVMQGAASPAEAASMAARLAYTQGILVVLNRSIGLSLAPWALHNSLLPQLGPLVSGYEGVMDPTESVDWDEWDDVQDWLLRRVGVASDWTVRANDLQERAFNPTAVWMRRLGFPVDRSRASWLDEYMGYSPDVTNPKGIVSSVGKLIGRDQ